MRLINIQAFLEREDLIRERKHVDRRTKVLEFCDDEATDYAILSHRWIDEEVDYDEMVELAKMEQEERDEIRQREGYRKILSSCEQAKKDGCKWVWVDTCCIDKRSSAELSEAINSMYRWYENSRVCYAYLHDVPGSSFPTEHDVTTYPNSNGCPEWFSRGWTLQEMIASSNVQFFNKDWQHIGSKMSLAPTLSDITGVPQHILMHGLSSNRPCVAQIISWAANRTTTRVEDRAYSLLGLLDVNMPMLYGEGKKAFHRLQLEIIRTSNDQSIFAWGIPVGEIHRVGSVLADDPTFFRDCAEMELIDHDEFLQEVKNEIEDIPEDKLPSIGEDQLGVFPITNRGIQIWLLLDRYIGSRSVFKAWLPCCHHPWDPPVSITLSLWKSNYCRYFTLSQDAFATEGTPQFRQVYLRYQDLLHRDITFEIDDSAITENGLTYCGTIPSEPSKNTVTLTNTKPLCIKFYCDSQADCRFAVGFGQYFGQDWINVVYEAHATTSVYSWQDYAIYKYEEMVVRGPEYAQSMIEARSTSERYGRVCIMHTHLPWSTWTLRTSCIMWESPRSCGVKLEIFPYSHNGPDKWTGFAVERNNDPNCGLQGLMIRDSSSEQNLYKLFVDKVPMELSPALEGIELGDYGYLADPEDFQCEGNLFADLKSMISESDIIPRQHEIYSRHRFDGDSDYVVAFHHNPWAERPSVFLYKPLGLSLPNDHHFNSLLSSLSTRLINRYLVTRVIRCPTEQSNDIPEECTHICTQLFHTFYPSLDTNTSMTTHLCTIAKPFVWLRVEDADFPSMESSGDELGLRRKMKEIRRQQNWRKQLKMRDEAE
ncbi:heterokaryon incompatibility protein-domain-containing protein [Scleroderma yunnanense]